MCSHILSTIGWISETWVSGIASYPLMPTAAHHTTALFALLLTTSGLEAVLYKWKYRRVQGADSKNSG